MNFKKTIAKSLVVAMALGMVPVANLQTAKAEAATVKLDGGTGLATATNAKFWGIAKKAKKAGKGIVTINGAFYKITNIQEYVGSIDLYSVLKGKAGVVAVGTTEDPAGEGWVVKEIPAAETTLKVHYLADKEKAKLKGLSKIEKAVGGEYGYLLATTGKSELKEVEFADVNLEAKLNDGSWKKLSELFGGVDDKKVTEKLKSFVQTASTITFRLVGGNDKWPSKESKFKVTAQAKAPNVKIDELKNTTSIKKGMEYQVVEKKEALQLGNWKKNEATKPLAFNDIKGNGADLKKDRVLLVRTSATDKKIASKHTMITLKKAEEAVNIPELKDTSATIDDKVTFALAVKYDISKGATLSN